MSRSSLRSSLPGTAPRTVARTARCGLLLALLGATSSAAAEEPGAKAAAAGAPGAGADPCLDDALCRAHYQRARTLSKADDLGGALAAYQAAYHRREVPWLLLNIGRTLHKLGKPAEAVTYYEQYLASGPTGDVASMTRARTYLREAQSELEAAQKNAQPKPAASPEPAQPLAQSAELNATTKARVTMMLAPDAPSTDGPEPEPSPPLPQVVLPPPVLVPVPTPSPSLIPAGRRLGFGLGIGATSLLTGLAIITGTGAVVGSQRLRVTTYGGTTPTDDILAIANRTRALAITTDVALAAAAVTLTVTLVTTFARKRPAVATPAPPVQDSPSRTSGSTQP
jgi:tetratricopeptide (TPR) repeat protein